MDGIQMLIQLIGGLGLFLYGMKLMGDGLENAAGENLKNILEKVTSNKFMGVLVGAIVTAIIQSSSATSVMVVSFVNAGLMNLAQTVGVTMGANIGTTITAQMVTLDFEAIVPLFIGIGAIMLLTVKKKRNKDLSAIILGFGILFLGMSTMSGAMEPLKESNAFKDVIDIMGNNVFLGILAGLVATAILQSSSATTGILVALGSTGVIEIEVAIPIILGCNIGTCITAVLASTSGNKAAKKAAFLNVLIKVVGVIIMLPFIGYLRDVVVYITSDVGKEIANAHTIFNVVTSIVLLPFSNVLVGIVNKVMPGEEEISMDGPIYLDKNLLETPIVAITQVLKETIRMGEISKSNVELAMRAFMDNDEERIKKVYENEEIINTLEKAITRYLVQLSSHELPESDSQILSATFHVINDLERIGDHAKNIVELATEKINNNVKIAPQAREEVLHMYDRTIEAVQIALDSYKNKDLNIAESIKPVEEKINNYEKVLRENNITRLNERICDANASTIYLDLISNLERIGDHATNIAETVV